MTVSRTPPSPAAELPGYVELIRLDAGRRLDTARRSALGQYFTPEPIARLIASLSSVRSPVLRIVDPGAGVGVLAANLLARICSEETRPAKIEVTVFEVDQHLVDDLRGTLEECRRKCAAAGVELEYVIRAEDFIAASVSERAEGLFNRAAAEFDCAILNPPYKKIGANSPERRALRELGIEATNLYAAFVSLALRSLRHGGELLAITPRSFCNGPYFGHFRRDAISLAALTHLHTFDARDAAFAGDEVLQENVVFRLARGVLQPDAVVVEWSDGRGEGHVARRLVPYDQVVHPGDPDIFIHVTPDEWDGRIAHIMQRLPATLATLSLEVSTGRVVDFRARGHLRAKADGDTVPLIYPGHFVGAKVQWPRADFKKPNAIARNSATEGLLNPPGAYVLVKRFSSKEEARRVVAATIDASDTLGGPVGFENHLNYFHHRGAGIEPHLAVGLATFLNSSLVDAYFRQFNGHTQVNATDLRKLRFPSREQLFQIAGRVATAESTQEAIDLAVEEVLLNMPDKTPNPPAAHPLIADALALLNALGLPRAQQNERSALTLLALLDLKPGDSWTEASNPLRGVTPIMDFAAKHYGKAYAPNTRETVRRSTLHQFRDAGLVVPNPDEPTRPVNSPDFCYQVPQPVLNLVRQFGSSTWARGIEEYRKLAPSLAEQYAHERLMTRIPLKLREGSDSSLSPGGQNTLIRKVVEEFCPRFTPGGTVLYIGDADKKWAHFDQEALTALGVVVDAHGKMPDVAVHFTERNWLVLVEAVTSHGPISPKRHRELKVLFGTSKAPLVYVTAFLDRSTLVRHLGEIAWETEVWVAESPSHMIHFNGERFLGPYE